MGGSVGVTGWRVGFVEDGLELQSGWVLIAVLFPFQCSPSVDTFFAACTCLVLEVVEEFFVDRIVEVELLLVSPDVVVESLWLGDGESE